MNGQCTETRNTGYKTHNVYTHKPKTQHRKPTRLATQTPQKNRG